MDKSTRSTRLPSQAPIRYTLEHATGTRIEADNAAPLPLDECILQMLPQQSYNGYDRPWAGGTAKNKLPPRSPTTVLSSGITYRATSDGRVFATGTATATSINYYPFDVTPGRYQVSCILDSALANVFVWDITANQRARKWDGTSESDISVGALIEVLIEEGHSYRINLRVRNGVTVDNMVFAPLLTSDTETDNTWEPYANVCPLRKPASPAALTVYGPDDVSSTWQLQLPFGPEIWGFRFDALTGIGAVNWDHLDVYDYNDFGDVPEPWLSSLDEYVPGTQPTDGAEVAWQWTDITQVQINPWDVRTYQGDNILELPDGVLTIAYTSYGDDDPPEALDIMIDLKEPTDVLHPTIELTLAGNPAAYNYMYIPEFERYYWLRDWTSYNLGYWSVSADVDVLASWRSQIMDLQLYVLRSAAAGDGRVIDHMYPAIADVRRQMLEQVADPWGVSEGTRGVYIVSICGSGETSYYAMADTEYKAFFTALLGDDYVETVMDYLPDWETVYPAAKLEINALQYIGGVKWYPMTSLPGVGVTPVTRVPVGYGHVDVNASKLAPLAVTNARRWTIPLRSIHPQSSRGVYLNLAPYSTIHAFVPPFGVFAISPATAAASGSLTITVAVDLRSGDGALRVTTSDGSVETELHAAIGVSVAIGQTVNAGYGLLDATGAAAGVVGGIAGAIGSFSTGNIAGGVGAVAGVVGTASSAIGNAISSQIPTTRTVGSPESIGALRGPLTVYSDHYMVAPEDITHRGRPLCQVRRLGDLPGYVLVSDADFMLPCMQEEHDNIRAMLEGGVFIE